MGSRILNVMDLVVNPDTLKEEEFTVKWRGLRTRAGD